ncbi:MAG: glycosyltransferase [Clostridia bacterium]|nr:glycosyltransferase [Clostridia bacterium]
MSSIGLMYDAKKVDLLVEAFLSISPPENYKLVLAGRFYTEQKNRVLALLSGSRFAANVVIEDRFLEIEDVNEYIAASDYVAATYDRHYANASLVFRACLAGKPLLLSDSGWLGRYGGMYPCGIMTDIHDRNDYAAKIRLLFSGNVENRHLLTGRHGEESFKQGLRKPLI